MEDWKVGGELIVYNAFTGARARFDNDNSHLQFARIETKKFRK